MDVHIDLAQVEYSCLSANLPVNSPMRHLFGPLQAGRVSIDCTREEAEGLLEVARRHCPEAVMSIQKAITRAGQAH